MTRQNSAVRASDRSGPAATDVGPCVSVIIPTYNRLRVLRRALSSLAAQTLPPDRYEVVVVDDGSDPPLTSADFPAVPYRLTLQRQDHQGPTAARNLGARVSHGGVLVFVDDDVCADPRALESMRDHCRVHPHVVVIGSLSVPEAARRSTFARVMADEHATARGNQEVAFTACQSGLLAIDREAFATLGGFRDPGGGWPNWDDVELGYRAILHGLRLMHIDDARGEHWDAALTDLATMCDRWERACPAAVNLFRLHPAIRSALPMFRDKLPLSEHDPPSLRLRKRARRAMSQPLVLATLERATTVLERRCARPSLLRPLYRWIIGAHLFTGLQRALLEQPPGDG